MGFILWFVVTCLLACCLILAVEMKWGRKSKQEQKIWRQEIIGMTVCLVLAVVMIWCGFKRQ
jgi:glucan phosphoethanolaminetransferase (alkaline phosphatase superfamily)